MTHAQARERLLDYVYGEMAPGDVTAFEAIARQDPDVRAELDEVAFVRQAVSGVLGGSAELPAPARRRILAAARRATWRRAWARQWEAVRASLRSPALLQTAAIVVAVGLAVPWVLREGRMDPGIAADSQEPSGSSPPTPAAEPDVGAAKPRGIAEPRPVDAARLLSDARTARAAGRTAEALDNCRRALAAEPTGDVLADLLAEAAEVAARLSRRAESDGYLDRLERLPGGGERAARIRGR